MLFVTEHDARPRDRARAQGTQRLSKSFPPWATPVPTYHLGDHVLQRWPQCAQNIGVGRTRVVIEAFDPPIVLSTDFSDSTQDYRLEDLPRSRHLHRSEQAMAARAVAQLALAPVLLACQQAFDGTEPGERVVSKQP